MFRYTSHEHARPWLIYSLKNVKGRGITDAGDVSEANEVSIFIFRLCSVIYVLSTNVIVVSVRMCCDN